MELIYPDDQPSILYQLVFEDAWIDILSDMTLQDLALTRRVCRDWYEEGKRRVTIYRIGFDRNGFSQWDTDKDPIYGWGMKISVDSRGCIRGTNKNNAEHPSVAKQKVYLGTIAKSTMVISVMFPETGQENSYTGSIVEKEGKRIFRGTFKLLRSCGRRQIGDGGTIEGSVLEA